MKEIYAAIQQHEERGSAKVTTSRSRNYCYVAKNMKSRQYKVDNNIKSNARIVFFFFFSLF